MEGVTEFGARLWFWLCGAPDFLWTPFLRVTHTFPGASLPEPFAPELRTVRDHLPYPLKTQFMASDRNEFLRAFKIVSDLVEVIDLNCGCPAPTVVGNGGGSSILADPDHFRETIAYLVDHVGQQRLSVKMRVGFHREDEFAELLDGIARLPLAHLTIHGRTRPDRYAGKARWSHMRLASEICAYPVIGSGDILGWRDIARIERDAPLVRSNIIGRGALRNPWVFEELRRGAEVQISGHAFIHSLACFALIEEAQHHHFDGLIRLIRDGHFKQPFFSDADAWQDLYARLIHLTAGELVSVDQLAFGRKTLGRLKMIWNYLRSSLPERFFAPQILRQKSIGEMMVAIISEWLEMSGDLNQNLPLKHQPDKDWVYAGGSASLTTNQTSSAGGTASLSH
jgi:tRNA-dihydrouridine synthase